MLLFQWWVSRSVKPTHSSGSASHLWFLQCLYTLPKRALTTGSVLPMEHLPKAEACSHCSCFDGSVIKQRKDLYRFRINPSKTSGGHSAFLTGSGLPGQAWHTPLRQILPVPAINFRICLRLPHHTPRRAEDMDTLPGGLGQALGALCFARGESSAWTPWEGETEPRDGHKQFTTDCCSMKLDGNADYRWRDIAY